MQDFRPFSLILVILLFSLKSNSQSPSDSSHLPITISGAVDAYYRYDLARTPDNALTSFTQTHNQFRLGMANLKIEHKTARVDMVADLAFGPREEAFAYNDNGITQAIKQLYISYSPNAWLKLTGGTWATHLCYESPDAFANRNYSMSYMFSNGPFSHTGVKADLTFGRNGFMIGIANPSDYRSIPTNGHNNKNIIAQYSHSFTDNIKFAVSYVGGRDPNNDRIHQFDLVVNAKTSDLLSLGFNATCNRSWLANEKYADERHWWGSALYANLDPKKWLGFTLRTEYFNDDVAVKLPVPAHIFATTLSANFRVDGFTLIPEFRLDNANNPIFYHADGSPAHSSSSFIIAAVYAF